MAIIKPFQSLRPQPELAQQVASRPYDVLNSEEARAEAKDNPFSFYMLLNQKLICLMILIHIVQQFTKKPRKSSAINTKRHFTEGRKVVLLHLSVSNEWKKPDWPGLCFLGGGLF